MSDKKIVMNLEAIMGDRFGKYSKYIIQERALPDVRDGLKPVQRRILYSMNKEGNTASKPYRKSAKTVGNVIGNYHPHGDMSVYDAMVRLSQEWKIRAPLIDMQGNNGSIDNDPAAAMRYTEARLSPIASELLRDLDKDTVLMSLNFDDTEYEPTVLPAAYPNLLVNGSTGISAGYATDIPPHNLQEVIDATIHRIKYPHCHLDKLMEFIKGPDFPTGAIVVFLLVLKISKYVSLSSISTALIVLCITPFLAVSITAKLCMLVAVILLVYRHKDNIKRIKNQTESKIQWM